VPWLTRGVTYCTRTGRGRFFWNLEKAQRYLGDLPPGVDYYSRSRRLPIPSSSQHKAKADRQEFAALPVRDKSVFSVPEHKKFQMTTIEASVFRFQVAAVVFFSPDT